MITQAELKEILNYDPDTGEFRWKKKPSKNISIGEIAGCIDRQTNYIKLRIKGKLYLSHRLAWIYVYGHLPTSLIDHKNHNKSDNRIENLREANKSENGQNRKGVRGYDYHKSMKKYRVRIAINGKSVHIGYFDTEEEARQAYLNAKANIHLFNPVPIEEQ